MDGESAPKRALASASKSVHIALTNSMCSKIRFGEKILGREMSSPGQAGKRWWVDGWGRGFEPPNAKRLYLRRVAPRATT